MRHLASAAVVLTLGWLAGIAAGSTTRANESCYGWATELVTAAQHCVSSVLPPQRAINYGPDILFKQQGAWCEGVPGHGIGEWVEVRLQPRLFFQSIYVVNGYAKSTETFRNNGRVKRFQIQTSDGLTTTATLEDRPGEQTIRLPRKANASWVRLTIAEVYPGERYLDTCLSGLVVDIEEYQR